MPMIDFGDGTVAFVCTRGKRRGNVCGICRERPGDKLCDYPLGGGKTCDRSLCAGCAVHSPPDTDFCPTHGKLKL
jgi:hypothetical protein